MHPGNCVLFKSNNLKIILEKEGIAIAPEKFMEKCSYILFQMDCLLMMMTRQRGGGVTLPGIISLELCQGWYLFLEAPTLSRYCPGGRAIQPGIHNLLLYERRLPDQRLHTLMKYFCVCTQTFVLTSTNSCLCLFFVFVCMKGGSQIRDFILLR